MTFNEAKELAKKNTKEYKCSHCVWGNKIIDDKENNVVNVMCLFPRCIKEIKKEKNNAKENNNISR